MTGIPSGRDGAVWDAGKKLLGVHLVSRPVAAPVILASTPTRVSGGFRLKPASNAVRISGNSIIVACSPFADVTVAVHQLNGSRAARFNRVARKFSLRRLHLSKGPYLARVEIDEIVLARHLVLH